MTLPAFCMQQLIYVVAFLQVEVQLVRKINNLLLGFEHPYLLPERTAVADVPFDNKG
jgi:hypothetical protein